ncbi:ATP-binding protein [Streptomyces sp. TM32]|uniref:ATP-binding protein n=1 Tax=Streptomyces sp. TM32 TaxID=1652669 RepID=UPI00101364EA|nr:ATP-binding protein [Streptomyces sp. TM32]RXS80562.1 ATP-binding protein [Streptomyces sp. TM32]
MTLTTAAAPAATVSPKTLHGGTGFAVAVKPVEAHVARMRRITTAHLRLWRVPAPLSESIVLALSELVTNGIVHGHGAVGLIVRYTADLLRIEVSDGNPAPAQLRHADDGDISGRGLFLVASLATDWGVSDGGTTTWCEFCLSTGRP